MIIMRVIFKTAEVNLLLVMLFRTRFHFNSDRTFQLSFQHVTLNKYAVSCKCRELFVLHFECSE